MSPTEIFVWCIAVAWVAVVIVQNQLAQRSSAELNELREMRSSREAAVELCIACAELSAAKSESPEVQREMMALAKYLRGRGFVTPRAQA